MIELHDAEETVAEYLSRIAEPLEETDDTGSLVPPGFPFDFLTRDNSVLCTAVLYQRYNGAVVLRIDAPITETQDSAAVRQWALTAPGHLPYVQIRFQGNRSNGRATLVATHSVGVDGLSQFALGQVVSSFDFIVPQWVEQLAKLEKVGAIEDARGNASASVAEPESSDDEEENSAVVVHEATGVEAVLDELGALIGLEPVKRLVRQLADVQRVANVREKAGLKAVRPSPHLVFTGNPGTGKTTVARLVGRLYREMGLLRKGHVVETGRHGLIGGYVGQTALKTKEVLESAEDGVLFIDEAYSLAVNHHLDYGREAIETILAHMENNRGRIAVVVAGYPGKMESFLRMNPGLASRFDHTLQFPDFTNNELVEVFLGCATDHDYDLTDAARAALAGVIASWPRGATFGNAREVRKLFNETVARHASSLVAAGLELGDGLRVIDAGHLPVPSRRSGDGFARSDVGYL